MSRPTVGSSKTKKLQGFTSIRANARRAFSPPLNFTVSLNTAGGVAPYVEDWNGISPSKLIIGKFSNY